jgi:E3 ubiquitin-protein ligase MARCH6
MLIELAVFPITMGYVVDFCSLPLFPDGTRASRMLTQQRHPVLSSFAHWICGTLFMYVTPN